METTVSPRPGDPGPSLVGRLLDDRYRLDSVIARGGMATVYLAIDTRLDRIVAVKVMHRALADDPSFVERFTREARSAAKVAGPEVVAVHDQGTDPETGLAYLVMEHVRGQNLRQLLRTIGPLSPSRAVSIMEPVLRALASAHAVGMVHRDVKPENVLLGDDGRVKVADFGLARAAESTSITQTSSHLMGSVAYLAPEQVETGVADARSDVYAAGVLLWELLTGAPPHAGETALSVAYQHVNADVPPPSTVVPGIPADLDALVVRATRRDPDSRPADAGEFLRELQAVAATLPVVAPTAGTQDSRTLVVPLVAPRTPRAPRTRRRTLISVVIAVVLGLLSLGGGYYLGSFRYTHTPSVYNLTLAGAEHAITKAGLHVKRAPDQFSDNVRAGLVMKQEPAGNARIRKNGTVTLVVSKGPDLRTVPPLVGKDRAAATSALAALGLSVAPNSPTVYSTIAANHVVSSDPVAGQRLRPGFAVRLTLSKGPQPVPVPDLTGKTVAEATSTLQGLGFKVTVVQQYDDRIAKGTVLSNQPNSGTAPKGSTVTLTVSQGPEFVRVPNLRYDTTSDATAQLQALGLVVAVQTEVQGGDGSLVLDTDPKAGRRVHVGTTVTLKVY